MGWGGVGGLCWTVTEKGGVWGLEARGGGAGAENRLRDRRTAAVLTKLAARAAVPYATLRSPLSNVLQAGSSRHVGLSGFDTTSAVYWTNPTSVCPSPARALPLALGGCCSSSSLLSAGILHALA